MRFKGKIDKAVDDRFNFIKNNPYYVDFINFSRGKTEDILYNESSFSKKYNNIKNIPYPIEKLKNVCISELDSYFSFNTINEKGFDYIVTENQKLTDIEKSKILSYFMDLYKKNYEGEKYGDFLLEIRTFIIELLNNKNVEFHFLYLDNDIVLTNFFKKINNNEIYWGGFNKDPSFVKSEIGKKFFNYLLNEKGKENDITGIVTYEIEGKENKSYKGLLRYYKSFGFEEYRRGETEYSKFITMKRKKG